MKKLCFLILCVLIFFSCEKECIEISAGAVEGTWYKDCSPYNIHGDIWIEDGTTLEIEAGVEVIFQDHYRFDINGSIKALGEKDNMIIITAVDSAKAWNGLRFIDVNPANAQSVLRYCKISYGFPQGPDDIDLSGGGIAVHNSENVSIEYCELYGNRTIGPIDDTYANRTGGGAIAVSNCSPELVGNIVHHNLSIRGHGGGIIIYRSESLLANNIIYGNEGYGGGGVCFTNLYNNEFFPVPLIINNTIYDNKANHGGGLDLIAIDPITINNIIYGNESHAEGQQIHLAHMNNVFDSYFFNNNIEGGFEKFAHNHIDMPPSNIGAYQDNLDDDPFFRNIKQGFCLSENSPCIHAGIQSIEIKDQNYEAPTLDQQENARPSDPASPPDIGALEHIYCK